MDALAELECMALNLSTSEEVTDVDIARWRKLFGFSSEEAQQHIESFRSDLGRTTISTEAWSILAPVKVPLGFDKESFEFDLVRNCSKAISTSNTVNNNNAQGTYIIKLEGPLGTVEAVQSVIGTKCPPELVSVSDEDEGTGRVLFCKVSASDRNKLLGHLTHSFPSFRPTCVRLAKATKALSTHSSAPCLGINVDCTLPHKRPSSEVVFTPMQDQYPVWYFFYGKLADPQLLRSLLALDGGPKLAIARVGGGKIKTWGGKYNAMVDAALDDVVHGWAYLVTSQDHEEALQFFETDMYEVVRCSITMENGMVVNGLVFRFCGPEEQLS